MGLGGGGVCGGDGGGGWEWVLRGEGRGVCGGDGGGGWEWVLQGVGWVVGAMEEEGLQTPYPTGLEQVLLGRGD